MHGEVSYSSRISYVYIQNFYDTWLSDDINSPGKYINSNEKNKLW